MTLQRRKSCQKLPLRRTSTLLSTRNYLSLEIKALTLSCRSGRIRMESWFTFGRRLGRKTRTNTVYPFVLHKLQQNMRQKIKRSGDRYEYRLPMDHISCSGWGPFKKCWKVETTDILTVVGFNKIRDGKPYGVVTTHCLGYQGRCPQWIINSPQIK